MTNCETFRILRNNSRTKLSACPYDQCCDGRECYLMRTDSKLNLKDDREQERKILCWSLASEKERKN